MWYNTLTETESAFLLEQVCKAVRDAGCLFADRTMAARVRRKGATDFVTDVDTAVQEQLKTQLAAVAPDIQFMGEEQDNTGVDLEGRVWILDPVDGTTNLMHAFRHSAVSLALAEGNRVILGVVYDPFANELFTAQAGKGAFCNGVPIHVSGAVSLGGSLCSIGTNPGCRQDADRAFQRMRAVYDRCHDIRRIGAASVELCYVAAGRLDCYVEHGLKPWDYAAGILIVQEAGGSVTTVEGQVPPLSESGSIAASNGGIHRELLSILQGV